MIPVSGCRKIASNDGGETGSVPGSVQGPQDSGSTADSPESVSTLAIPLTDLETGNYQGLTGGLYPNGSNTMPSGHYNEGLVRAARIQPHDLNGNLNAGGRYVLLSVGMSNAAREFCSIQGAKKPCESWSFMGQAAQDASVNKSSLVLVNGAQGSQPIEAWDDPSDSTYTEIKDHRLSDQNVSHEGLALSEDQVQVIWLKNVTAGPTVSLPDPDADAYALEARLAKTIRTLKVRYPNLQMVFLSSRSYAGYADPSKATLSPEPYAYETGFAVKRLVQAQIDQMANGGTVVDPLAGDLNYDTVAPWIAWGPYLWADGTTSRSDGLTWNSSDFDADGTHPSPGPGGGEEKVGGLLLDFFKTSSLTKCWFVTNEVCH